MGQINARDWIFEVEDPDTSDTFLELAGRTSFTVNPAEGEETADTTVFESNGMMESQAMQRGATLSIEGMRVVDSETGEVDPGQAACDTLAGRVGEESLGTIRFRHKSEEDEWTVWDAWASAGEQGGETNAKTSWSVTFTRSGAASTEPVDTGA